MIGGLFAFLANTTITWVFVASVVAALGWRLGIWIGAGIARMNRRAWHALIGVPAGHPEGLCGPHCNHR